jgi:hypothetical protein
MTERLLQYIWQFQYYDHHSLETAAGEALQIVHQGIINTNQGPDFLNGKIRIGDTTWAGNIELHIFSSEWHEHKHSSDRNYDNVILHVVWKQDDELTLNFPVLELYDRIPNTLLSRYEELMMNSSFIPCQEEIVFTPSIILTSWKDRLLAERLEQKSKLIEGFLLQNKSNWEETFWWLLARNFGSPVNSDAFEELARSVPVNVLVKNKNSLISIEAILFGQAKLLNRNFADAYPIMLKKEYAFLQKKYGLNQIFTPVHSLRMRPANFPCVRLAQLAALVAQSHQLFSVVRETADVKQIRDCLSATANDYWHYHYQIDEMTAFKIKVLGEQMSNNIIVNTVIPALFTFANYSQNAQQKERAIRWMQEMPAEKNKISLGFEKIGLMNEHAADSQALIRLKQFYCNERRCLQCAIGNNILHPSDKIIPG